MDQESDYLKYSLAMPSLQHGYETAADINAYYGYQNYEQDMAAMYQNHKAQNIHYYTETAWQGMEYPSSCDGQSSASYSISSNEGPHFGHFGRAAQIAQTASGGNASGGSKACALQQKNAMRTTQQKRRQRQGKRTDATPITPEERRKLHRSTKKYKQQHARRERFRVTSFNTEFAKLRELIPVYPPNKKLPKINILRMAINYIHYMDRLIRS